MNARRIAALAGLAAAAAALAGCGATESLGLNDYLPRRPAIYDKAVVNNASRVEPFAQRLRYPVPDRSWERESASEYEPWTQLGR